MNCPKEYLEAREEELRENYAFDLHEKTNNNDFDPNSIQTFSDFLFCYLMYGNIIERYVRFALKMTTWTHNLTMTTLNITPFSNVDNSIVNVAT